MIKVTKKTTKGDIARVILATIKASGFLATALVAPGALISLKKLGILNTSLHKNEVIYRARNYLLKNGFLKKNAKGFLELTLKGEEKLRKYQLSHYELFIPRTWDGKWRMLIFDIPEHKKSLRNKIRTTLISIGFESAQDSVWIFPYDCEEFVALLKVDFKVGKDLLYLVIDKIENDRYFKKKFNLN